MNKKKRKKTSTKRTRYMTAQFGTLQGETGHLEDSFGLEKQFQFSSRWVT